MRRGLVRDFGSSAADRHARGAAAGTAPRGTGSMARVPAAGVDSHQVPVPAAWFVAGGAVCPAGLADRSRVAPVGVVRSA